MQRFYSATTGWNYVEGINEVMPDDAQPISEQLYLSLLGKEIEPGPDGLPREKVAPPPSFEQRAALLLAVVDAHLNATAKEMGYDDIRTAVTYAEEPAVPKFQAEGQALRAWRSLVYAKCYEVLAKVQANEIAEPDEAQLIAMLPALQLPQ